MAEHMTRPPSFAEQLCRRIHPTRWESWTFGACDGCKDYVLAVLESDWLREQRIAAADAALAPVEAVLPTGPRPFVDLHSIGRWNLAQEVRAVIAQSRAAAKART